MRIPLKRKLCSECTTNLLGDIDKQGVNFLIKGTVIITANNGCSRVKTFTWENNPEEVLYNFAYW